MRVDNIKLRLGSPQHGSMSVDLVGPEGSSSLYASAVPGDSLRMLANAGCTVLESRADTFVVWFLEPEEITWHFQRRGDLVRVTTALDKGERAPLAEATAQELGAMIWRAMRRLEVDPAWRRAPSPWSRGFPTNEVSSLGRLLRGFTEQEPDSSPRSR